MPGEYPDEGISVVKTGLIKVAEGPLWQFVHVETSAGDLVKPAGAPELLEWDGLGINKA
jgi:hypothetical protein